MAKLFYKASLWVIAAATFFMSLFVTQSYAYELTEQDYIVLDTIEDRLFTIMESNPSLTPQKVIAVINKVIETRPLQPKTKAIFQTLVDDITFLSEADDTTLQQAGFYMLPEDCLAEEYYSTTDEWCYPKTIEEKQDQEIDYPVGTHWHHEHEEEAKPEASYAIQSDDTLTLLHNEANKDHTKQHTAIREIFRTLIPASFRQDLLTIHFTRDSQSDTFAHVNQIAWHTDAREMTLNLAQFYTSDGTLDVQESYHTLVHEYAHILTLNKTQVAYVSQDISDAAWQRYQSKCVTYFLSEGCLKQGSYLDAFITKFWSQKDLDAVWQDNPQDVYKENNFVSEYAASNPGEDIAESFTYFIAQSKPQGKTLADQKIQFFYQYPELVQLRNIIRNRYPKSQ